MSRRFADPRCVLVGALALVVMAWPGPGRAATTTVASDPVFGGGDQVIVFCTFTNAGASTITLSGYAIVGEKGALPLSYDMCSRAPLAAGGDCQIAANTNGGAVCVATATSTGPTSGLRGVADARDASSEPLWSMPVH